MAISISISADVKGLQASLAAKSKGIADLFRRKDFQNAVQSYIIGKTTRMVRELGTVGDAPSSKSARGVRWAGFKTWTSRKYGMQVPEGTRFYWRGRKRVKRRDDLYKRFKFRAIGKRGTPAMEKVWKRRASGRKYSATSKLMQDTGALVGMTAHVKRSLATTGGVSRLILRAGTNVKYFAEQHRRRPIWFWYSPEDGPAMGALVQRFVAGILGAKRQEAA